MNMALRNMSKDSQSEKLPNPKSLLSGVSRAEPESDSIQTLKMDQVKIMGSN